MSEYYIGLMSGTSMDSIDAVLVDLSGNRPELLGSVNRPWPKNIHNELMATQLLGDNELDQLNSLDINIAKIFSEAVNELLIETGILSNEVIAIGSHGQTIRHRPDANNPFSLQLGDARTLAQRTKLDVVSNFRTADISLGGQGAPLAPAFHAAVFQSTTDHRTIINLGGIANLTFLPDKNEVITGFDTGPANTLMDNWIRLHQHKEYDENGTWAKSGTVHQGLLLQLLEEKYFQLPPPKSTGVEYFNLEWLYKINTFELAPEDVQATLCELTARTVADSIKNNVRETHCLVCGGGVHNSHLLERIKNYLPDYKINSTEEYGVHPDWVEAMAFAWLAKQTIHGLPGNIPTVTGASKAVTLGEIESFIQSD